MKVCLQYFSMRGKQETTKSLNNKIVNQKLTDFWPHRPKCSQNLNSAIQAINLNLNLNHKTTCVSQKEKTALFTELKFQLKTGNKKYQKKNRLFVVKKRFVSWLRRS